MAEDIENNYRNQQSSVYSEVAVKKPEMLCEL